MVLLFAGVVLLEAPIVSADSLAVIFHFVGEDSTSHIGVTLGALGDVNGDGYADFSVNSLSPAGTYVFYGGDPPDTIPDLFLRGRHGVAAGVDLDGDSHPDIITTDLTGSTVYLFRGYGDSLGSTPSDSLSPDSGAYSYGSCPAVGLVNNDVVGDLLVVDRNVPGGGKAYYYSDPFTSDKDADWVFTVEGYSHQIHNADFIDYDGDQVLDICLSLGGDLDTSGYVYIYRGPDFAETPDIVIAPPLDFETLPDSLEKEDFAHWAGNVGDFNGDGYDDLVVLYNTIPLIYLCGPNADTLYDLMLASHAGRCIAGIGDINGDGGNDIALGPVRYYLGGVDVYLGGEDIDTIYDWTITDADLYPYPGFTVYEIGYRVAGAGDVNNDGYDDLLITCRVLPCPTGQPHVVYLVAGSPDIVVDVVEIEQSLPQQPFLLNQNYPNPFNSTTTISFEITVPQHVRLTVYNIMGRQVKVLTDESLRAGEHSLQWDGTNDDGKEVASGVYLYRLQAGETDRARKMLLLK